MFCNEVKGKSALALSRDLGLSYKSAFVLLHKLREAMAEEMNGRIVGGEGKMAEVDGGYFGGYVKPANRAKRSALTVASLKIRTASARWSSSSVSAAGTEFPPCSIQRAKLPPSFAPVLPRGLWCTPMKPDHGTTCMNVSKSSGSTIKRPIRWMAPARTGRRNTSAVFAVLKSASTITLRAHEGAAVADLGTIWMRSGKLKVFGSAPWNGTQHRTVGCSQGKTGGKHGSEGQFDSGR